MWIYSERKTVAEKIKRFDGDLSSFRKLVLGSELLDGGWVPVALAYGGLGLVVFKT